MMPKRLLAPLLCLSLSAAADEPPATPAERIAAAVITEDAIDRTPKSCLTRAGLRKTAVADDRTVLFVRRKDIYINILRRACPGLARGTAISYQVRGGRTSALCRGDTISAAGLDISCSLGSFHEVSEAQALALLNPVETWSLDGAIGFDARPARD